MGLHPSALNQDQLEGCSFLTTLISSLVLPYLNSLNGELQEEKENDLLPDEKYFPPSGHPDSSDSQELLRSSALPSDDAEVALVPRNETDGKPTKKLIYVMIRKNIDLGTET